LGTVRLDGFHVDLVFEVDIGHVDLADQLDHPARLGQIARQRLFADDALQFGAGLDRIDDLLDRRQPRVVRGIDDDDVDVRNHLAHAGENPPRAQSHPADFGRQFLGRTTRDKPRHIDAADFAQPPQLKRADEPAADNPVPQSIHR
jgi:hypothetical protein